MYRVYCVYGVYCMYCVYCVHCRYDHLHSYPGTNIMVECKSWPNILAMPVTYAASKYQYPGWT